MAVFKFVVSEPKSRKSFQMEVDQTKAIGLVGKKIGEDFNGDVIGMSGYVLKITGGTDKDGFPMHPSLKGRSRKKLLLDKPPGFKPAQKGQRKRKMVRGDTVSEDIVQINVKVTKLGEKPFEQLAPKKEAPKKEEEAKEVPKEAPKPEPKETPKEKPAEASKKKEKSKVEKKSEAEKKPEPKPASEQKQPEAKPEQNPEPKPEEKKEPENSKEEPKE
jgi:small subunit ribosomal protein S6e